MVARVAAPLAFLVLATLGIVAVRAALNESPSTRPGTTPTVTTTAPQTETETTETTGTTARQFYRVQAGDTLESIASRNGTTVERLLELNPGIDPVALRIGQRIRVG
jgi:LysM repeat protein